MTNQLVQAIMLGGYYAVIASGLSFMFSVMGIINLAHGSFIVLGAYILLYLADSFGISPFIGLLIILPLMAALGWVLQRFLLERSARGGELLPILTTFGLAIVIDNLLFQQVGADTRSLAPYIGDLAWESWELPDGIFVGKISLMVLAAAVMILGGLHFFLKHTQIGRAIRATAADPDTAGIVGINARRASAIAAMIAMGTVGVASVALSLRGSFDAYAGAPQLLFAFEVTIIGGVGSLWGTLLGGMVLAIAQTFGASVHPQGFLLGGHLAFLVVLFARLFIPSGAIKRLMFRKTEALR